MDRRLLLALLALGSISSPSPAQSPEADARWERLQAERAAEGARRREAQERYEQGVRDAAAARQRYEADMARHNQEVERARAAQAEYDRRVGSTAAPTASSEPARESSAASESRRERRQRTAAARDANEQCRRRARGRGRLLGGLIGGVAGGIVGRNGGSAAEMVAISAPVSLLMAEAITRLLDCREQEQAAAATEQVVQQAAAAPPASDGGAARGVGTTVSWASETRPGVTGSSTVTALEEEPGGGECVTVTDIVIVDGQETRAPKRLCRRPPSQRFVRV